MDNQRIAEIFGEIADMMDIKGEDFFRVNAYRHAARVISNTPYDIADAYVKQKKIGKIPGVGKALEEKIIEMIKTGRCTFHEDLIKGFPKGLLDMLRVRGIGPKKVKLFFGELHIHTLAQLKKAAEDGLLQKLPKMGKKSEADILRAIQDYEAMPHERKLLHEGLLEAQKIINYLRKAPGVMRVQYAGSLRRGVETIGDIDILSSVKNAEKNVKLIGEIMEYYAKYPEVAQIINQGDTKSSVLLKSGLQVDLRVVDDTIFGAALHYFTGSKGHNIRIRDRAKNMGLKVSEYGVFKMSGRKETLVAGKTEEELFTKLGLPYIIPEMREDQGEIEYGLKHKKMPIAIEFDDLKADLHTHSKWSDGSEDIDVLAAQYKKAGFEYMALTDHSKAVGVAGGMDEGKVMKQWKEIDKVTKSFGGKFRILKGSEVDILKDGSLDFSDAVLKKLEVINASAHLYHQLDEKTQTKRLLRAIESGYVKILSHPTGRLINQRKPISFDVEAVFKACADHRVALEINSSPDRMDLKDTHVRMAKELGCKFAINSDSHHSSQMGFLQYGITIARRAWLTKEDVINTMTLKELLKYWKIT